MGTNQSRRPALQAIYSGRGRIPQGNVAVIDIGSNSIRLVVYDSLDRTPLPVFNEKVLCGLGRGLAESGRLNPDGIGMAKRNIARFTRLLHELNVGRVDVLATAAVRDAEDGAQFVTDLEQMMGREITVLPGEEEARLAAFGVLSGMPEARGVVGDLGGGSLELVGLDAGALKQQVTLPLGPFRVGRKPKSEIKSAVDEILSELDWLDDFKGRDFYPVGGAWRSIAKVQLASSRHAIKVIHNHVVGTREIRRLVRLIAQQGGTSLAKLPGVSRRRLETLPYAALLMDRLLDRLRPGRVVFSAYGLREGHLFSLLPASVRKIDPLLHAAAKVDARSESWTSGDEIHAWLSPLFADESAEESRWRRAACLLSDVAAGEHPEYRAEHGFLLALRAPIPGINHAGRAFVATSLFVRYGGKLGSGPTTDVVGMMDERSLVCAQILGTGLRLAHTLTAGATGVLSNASLDLQAGSVTLRLGEADTELDGEVVRRRLDALARALDRPSETQVGFPAAAE